MVATFTTDLDIVKQALQYLGAKSNISTTDKTNSASEMQVAFRLARDVLIRSYNWNCCIKEDNLALNQEVAGAEYPYIYSLPSDYLKLIKVNGLFTGYSGIEPVEQYSPRYKVRGNKLYAKQKPPYLVEYSYRNEDVSSYDADFCKVLALDLAIATCERITQSTSKLDNLQKMRRAALDDALRANALEIPARPKPTGNWLRSRRQTEWGQE